MKQDVLGLVNLDVVHLSLVSDLLKRRYLRNTVWKNVVTAKEIRNVHHQPQNWEDLNQG